MGDSTRSDILRHVYTRLADPKFRRLLTAKNADGDRPVIVALREDLISSVLAKVRAAGGAGNVAVPMVNGVVLLALTYCDILTANCDHHPSDNEVRTDCTVGVFTHRVIGEASGGTSVAYVFRSPPTNTAQTTDRGSAELVALSC